MSRSSIKLLFLVLSTGLSSCLLFKGHFTEDGSMWIWNKDPSGRYNAHNPLQLEKANAWVDTVLTIPAFRQLIIESTSAKWGHYEINDSTMFFKKNDFKLPDYNNYEAFAKRMNIDPELLKRLVMDFDKLGLNRFYREEAFLGFTTSTYLNYSKGYFYFPDSTAVANIHEGDTLDFRNNREFKNFRTANVYWFLITKKYNNHWLEWYTR